MRGVPFILVLALAAPLAGCVVPDNAQTLREDLGFAQLDVPVVTIRASQTEPTVRQAVELVAVVVGGEAPLRITWTIGDAVHMGDLVVVTFDRSGPHEVRVEAVTAQDVTASDTLTIHVRPNGAPRVVASVDGPPEPAVGDQVRLRADASSDPEGDPLTFTWVLPDGAELDGSDVTHRFTKPGVHAVAVRVSDGIDTSEATVPVAIDAVIPVTGRTETERTLQLPFEVGPGARSIDVQLSFQREGMVEEVRVVLVGPDGQAASTASAAGFGGPGGSVGLEAQDPKPGSWLVEVSLEQGVGAVIDGRVAIDHAVPA